MSVIDRVARGSVRCLGGRRRQEGERSIDARTDTDDSLTLVWLTNVPAPYRVALWEALSTRYSLHVLCLTDREVGHFWRAPNTRVPVHNLRAHSVRVGATPLYWPTTGLLRRVWKYRRDVWLLDGWESPAFLLVILALVLRGRPPVLAYRATPESSRSTGPLVGFVRRRLFCSAAAVLAGGQVTARVVADLGVRPDRIVVTPNVIDAGGLHRRVTQTRAAAGRAHEGHRFLFVGQLVARKNLGALLTAFDSIAQPADSLTVVGDGPMRTEWVHQAERLEHRESVSFRGPLAGADLERVLAGTDTLVLPSTEEIWGIVVNEALAAGCQAVVSDRAGAASHFAGQPGVFISPPNVTGLAGALAEARELFTGWIERPQSLAEGMSPAVDAVAATVALARGRR